MEGCGKVLLECARFFTPSSMRSTRFLLPLLSLALLLCASQADAATLVIEQKNVTESIGKWTLIKPDNERLHGVGPLQTLNDAAAGSYLLIVEPPQGATTKIRVYRGDEVIDEIDRPQISIALTEEENLNVVIHYALIRVGGVAVRSDPLGIPFKMTGPNETRYEGVTPMDYQRVAEGLYSVQYESLEGCVTAAPKSDVLQKESRISFTVTFDCAAADKLRERQNGPKDPEFVEVGNDLFFRDVPQSSWFATYVFDVAKLGILTGYRDESGNPTGDFGPGNAVTVAELATIAHRAAGLDEKSMTLIPGNPLAQNQWFSSVISSAEQRGWTIYNDLTIDPLRPATRGEVLVTILQALDVPMGWAKGQMFRDVTPRIAYAAAVETATLDGIVDGRTDESGEATGSFGPTDPVNRAEMAKIMKLALDLYRVQEAE